MQSFIPKEKLNKKARRAENQKKRQTWGSVNPITRTVPGKTKYKRKKSDCRTDDYGSRIFDSIIPYSPI